VPGALCLPKLRAQPWRPDMRNMKQHLAAVAIGVAALLSWLGLISELQHALVPPLLVVM